MRNRLLLFSSFKMIRNALKLFIDSANDIEVVGEIGSVEDLEQAIKKLRPVVVLAEMIDVSGPVTSDLAALVRREKTNLIILANRADGTSVRALFKLGVTGIILKQSSEKELLLAIRSGALGRRFLDATLLDEITLEAQSPVPLRHKDVLSSRESQVLAKLIQGYTGVEIAKGMGVTVKTVETYRARIYKKLELRSRADLVRYAVSKGLLSIDKKRLA